MLQLVLIAYSYDLFLIQICLSAYYLLADLFLNKAPLHSEPSPPESRNNSSCSEAETVGQESTDGKIMQSVISQVDVYIHEDL